MSTALVIDYTREITALVRIVLRTMNGIDRVDTASRGDTAARLIEAVDYDVVLLEPVVPYGEERFLAWLTRARPSVCRRTILVTAAPIAPALLAEIARASVYALLDKPFDVDALAAAVGRCIGVTPARAIAVSPAPRGHAA